MKIDPTETKIAGQWKEQEGNVVEDENCKRIKNLTESYLQRVTSSEDGWTTLYKDPEDGRYWELTYPNSDWHGGGPPVLVNISTEEAHKKYALE